MKESVGSSALCTLTRLNEIRNHPTVAHQADQGAVKSHDFKVESSLILLQHEGMLHMLMHTEQ